MMNEKMPRDEEGDNENLVFEIARLNALPMAHLRFKDFQELKSGRDAYSNLKYKAVQEMLSIDQIRLVEAAFDHHKDQAAAMRWIARGLDADKAVRKVQTDIEIGCQAAKR